MDEAKENVDFSSFPRSAQAKVKGSKQEDQERAIATETKKTKQKKEAKKTMATNPQQNMFQTGEDQHQNAQDIQTIGDQVHAHPRQQADPKKNRKKEATELANHAAEKHAQYYDGTLKSLCNTFPVQKSISTYNRLKGSGESTDQTLNHLIHGLHTIDFGISFIVWRLFFYAKDLSTAISNKTSTKGNELAKMLSAASVPTLILMTVGLVCASPLIIGFLLFAIPTVLVLLAMVIIPAIFVAPFGFFVIFLIDLLPLPNKPVGSVTKNSFGRIPIFNRFQRPNKEGGGGEEIRSTMVFQQKAH